MNPLVLGCILAAFVGLFVLAARTESYGLLPLLAVALVVFTNRASRRQCNLKRPKKDV